MGKSLLDSISRNGFKILNDKKPTCGQGNTVIDLAILKGTLDCQVASYTDSYPILSTIHNPIITKIGQVQNVIEAKYNTKLSNDELNQWKMSLKRELENWKNLYLKKVANVQERETLCEQFIEAIEKSVKLHFKKKLICKYSKPWMKDSIKKAIKDFRRHKRLYVKRNNPTNLENFSDAKSRLESLIRNEIDNHWKNFQNETAQLPQQKFWKKITNFVNDRSQHAVQPIYDTSINDLVWDDKSILDKLVNTHLKRNNDLHHFDEYFKREVESKVEDIIKNGWYIIKNSI